jgi:hypothetical protein
VTIEAEGQEDGIRARIIVAPGVKIEHPVHLCFGMTTEEGLQRIESHFEIGEEAEIGFLAHCTFPQATQLKHVMEAQIHVGSGATMRYGVVETIAKAYGSGDDAISIKELIRLNGKGARGLTKTRAAVRDQAISEVYTTAEGNAPDAIGHMDCTEIVRNQAQARNVPIVVVRDERARVTHEAAIGSVGQKELETLMARGLDEEEAVDIIIRGMLRG